MKWEMSPFDCVTIWNYIWIFTSVWKCHHLNMSPFENISNQSPYWYESTFFIFTIFFRPSIHMVTNVTIWVLGLKIFTPVTKKWLSNGDDQKGFTIEASCGGKGLECWHFTRDSGDGFAETIGVDVAIDRESLLVITDSLSRLGIRTRLFKLSDRSFCSTDSRISWTSWPELFASLLILLKALVKFKVLFNS